uniref:Si:ch211-66k16.27 n=1 Tax=Poecilia latipinna TaxID=48699 RepID=A0A3B3VR58_9TELE
MFCFVFFPACNKTLHTVTIVDDMRDTLIQKNTKVMAITRDLLKMRMIHEETYSEIEARKTNQDKMRELYKSLRASDLVKVAFYDALKEREPNILNSHGKN